MAERSVPDIAREALRLLAARRLPPTPDNYQSVYEEVAGYLPRPPFPSKALRHIFSVLPTQSLPQQRIALHFNQAINEQNWHGVQQAIVAYAHMDQVIAAHQPAGRSTPPPATPQLLEILPLELAEQLARVLENILPMLSEDEDRRMHELTDQLVSFLRQSPPSLQDLLHMLQNFAYRLSFATEDQAQRRLAIQGLLRTVVTHTAELNQHDATLQSHSAQLLAALEQPWTQKHLDILQQQLQTLLLRQLDLHDKAQHAQQHIKALLSEALQRLSSLTDNNSAQTSHIEQCASKLEQAQGLADMAPVLEDLLIATRAIASENRVAHAALDDLRERSDHSQQSLAELRKALSEVEQITHHDPLTQALNTKGLHEGLEREMSRASRYRTPISLASVALEGMHALGVEHGSDVVDQAQRHFAIVARSVLRPQDLLARDQPNHFFVVLPSAEAPHALQALARLQNELERRPLLSEDEKICLHINAGVVQAWPSESHLDLMNRADLSLHHAQMKGTSGELLSG